jgi:hypothetical protein
MKRQRSIDGRAGVLAPLGEAAPAADDPAVVPAAPDDQRIAVRATPLWAPFAVRVPETPLVDA